MAHSTYLFVVFLLSLDSINGFIPAPWLKAASSDLGFSWKNCGSSSDPLQLKSLKLSPDDPIQIPGNETVSLVVAITSTLPRDMHASLTLEKKFGNFFIKVPCEYNVGSCNYDNICEKWSEFCLKYFEKYDFPCQCPIPPNTYSVPDTMIEAKNKISSQIEGEFKLTVNLSGSSGRIGCLKFQFKLK